ncbi:MAG TPA: RNA methyltransferase [Polyangiaceae bacterium]|nr:RNA methyltransferase [Polyangiaceae bacterium]
MRSVAVALLHHPVLDRGRGVVTTAVTNLDLHDIARSAHTFDVSPFFVVHPIAAQRELVERVRAHWVEGSGGRRIPDRAPALRAIRVVASFEDALAELPSPEVWVTSADERAALLDYDAARARLEGDGPPVLIVFGTGWGLADSVCEKAAYQLEPIRSPRSDGYNHLSVRAAAAITFDRLLRPR